MTDQAPVVTDTEAEIRWRDWQTRAAQSDRLAAARLRTVVLLVLAALVAWLVVRLA